jgi:Uma2 family endonuclease
MSLFSHRKDPVRIPQFDAYVADKPEEERWELIDGEIVLQASPVETHQIILGNLLDHLRPAARRLGPDYRAITGINVRVDTVDTYSPVPDILVRCGPPAPKNVCTDPIGVVEVLSPGTQTRDRGFKADFYRVVPSVQSYLAVAADEPRVEIWRRRSGQDWTFIPISGQGDVALPELELSIPLAAIYAGTDVLSR